MPDEALVRLAKDVQARLGTDLALPEFAREVRRIVGADRYQLLLCWSSRCGPKLSAAEFADMEQLAQVLRTLAVGWEFIEAPKASRHAERQGRQ